MTFQPLSLQAPFALPFDATQLQLESSQQKRALSYASTLHYLMQTIVEGKLPADRVLGHYFREHKRHGSKDRKVIRETLFAIFRWWGWLQYIPARTNQQQDANQAWLAILASTGKLEQHPWQNIVETWAELAQLSVFAPQAALGYFAELHLEKTQLLPDWFWAECELTTDQLALAEIMSQRPPIWARAQGAAMQAKPTDGRAQLIAELQAAEIPATASDYFADALSLGHKSIALTQVKAYEQGRLEIQDLASQVIGQICAPKPQQTWWESCAGAGGKSLQLSSLAQQQGGSIELTASDIRGKALEELQKRAKRAGFKVKLAKWQSEALPVPAQSFDGVLVDAPCSCTGTWRRNPDLRWLTDVQEITDKPALQLDILRRASAAVKIGGELVYATCSIVRAENEAVVDAFLAANTDFELVTIQHPFTGEATQMLTVWPQQADSDGMFVAKMRRLN